MPSPTPLTARVLVKGTSNVSWISWMGGPRSDFAFPRAIEAALIANGRPAEVRNAALMGARTRDLLRGWEQEVLQWSPDVVVIMAGHYDAVHLFLPRWFERHANRADRMLSTGLSHFYFRRVIRSLWKLMAKVQARVDGPLGVRILRRRMRRVAIYVESYFDLVKQVGSPLVIVLELLPPSGSKGDWFPGMHDRIVFINEQLRQLVERHDRSDVRFLPVGEIARRLVGEDMAAAIPDGFHYSPALHREVGIEIARAIDEWAKSQPHLSANFAGTPATRPTIHPAAEQPATRR